MTYILNSSSSFNQFSCFISCFVSLLEFFFVEKISPKYSRKKCSFDQPFPFFEKNKKCFLRLHLELKPFSCAKQFSLFLREDVVTWYCEQPTASPPEWARVYCGLRPGPTRVMPPSRQDEEGHQSASSYVHCLCWRTCCCTWMCVLAVLLLSIGLVCPHPSSPDS